MRQPYVNAPASGPYPSIGLLVVLERTDPQDPIRNIRVIMPGYEQAAVWGDQPFHPAFLEFLRPFGVLRFMDWMHSNAENLPKEWDERPRPEDMCVDSAWGPKGSGWGWRRFVYAIPSSHSMLRISASHGNACMRV